jgi:hypothetical protein
MEATNETTKDIIENIRDKWQDISNSDPIKVYSKFIEFIETFTDDLPRNDMAFAIAGFFNDTVLRYKKAVISNEYPPPLERRFERTKQPFSRGPYIFQDEIRYLLMVGLSDVIQMLIIKKEAEKEHNKYCLHTIHDLARSGIIYKALIDGFKNGYFE